MLRIIGWLRHGPAAVGTLTGNACGGTLTAAAGAAQLTRRAMIAPAEVFHSMYQWLTAEFNCLMDGYCLSFVNLEFGRRRTPPPAGVHGHGLSGVSIMSMPSNHSRPAWRHAV